MWNCSCGIRKDDKEACGICGQALEEDINDSNSGELEEILDQIEELVSRARKLLKGGS